MNEVHNNKHDTAPEQIHFTPGIPNDQSALSKTSGSSKSNSNSSSSVTHHRKNIVTMTSYPFRKDPIFPREVTEPHGTKPHYEGSENSHTEHSHGGKDIPFNEDME